MILSRTWSVVIGPARLPVEGAELVVEAVTGPVGVVPGLAEYADATAAVAVPPRPPRRTLPAALGLKWVAGDFHAHSLHSDGSTPIANLAALGVAAGWTCWRSPTTTRLLIISNWPGLSKQFGIGLIPGQEVTTESGHATPSATSE